MNIYKHVVCIVGKSGSGKNTLVNNIVNKLNDDKLNIIKSFTTREPRHKNDDELTFLYNLEEYHRVEIDDENIQLKDLDLIRAVKRNSNKEISVSTNDIIAYQKLYGNTYFATNSQVLPHKVNFYVVDPKGSQDVINYYNKHNDLEEEMASNMIGYQPEYVNVEVIYIGTSKQIREERLINRYRQHNPNDKTNSKAEQEYVKHRMDRDDKEGNPYDSIVLTGFIDGDYSEDIVCDNTIALLKARSVL